MGEVIVIVSGKGGVGKTTSAAHIGAAFAVGGKRVALIDADMGLRNLDIALGAESKIVYDLADVLDGVCSLDEALLKAVFELRILSLSGYTPDLVACNDCGEFDKDIFYFNYNEGIISCEECIYDKNATAILDRTLLSAMRHIIYCDFEKLFSFKIPQEYALRLSKITEKYLLSQTEQRFSTLDFYNSIL